MKNSNNINQLWHSAQSLDNTSPNIIYEGHDPIPFQEQEKRQKIVSEINTIVSYPKRNKWSNSSDVIIYYTPENFVIESTPNKRDNYNRLSAILTYGSFPTENNNEDIWIEDVATQVEEFADSINRELSSATKKTITKALKEIRKELQEKKHQDFGKTLLVSYAIQGAIALAVPLLIGGILYIQIPQILIQQVPHQNTQTLTMMTLQEVIQKLVFQLTVLIAINNVLVLMIAKLPIAKMLTREYDDRYK